MRVLHCIASMGGGGAERQLCYLASGLVERGHEVVVALQRGGPNLPRLEASGATVRWIDDLPATDPRLFASVVRVVRGSDASLVQTWLPRMDVVAGAAALVSGLPWVLTERNSAAAGGRRAREAIGRFASAVVANSATGAEEWAHAGPRLVRAIPNATPVSEVDAAEVADLSALGVPAGAPLVVYTGRIWDTQKNVFKLTDALIDVLRERPEVYAVCAGEGPDREAVVARSARAGLADRLIFPGYVDSVFSLLRRADVFVSPSRFEGRPNTVAEAMAARAPACLSNIPQHTEFVPPDGALFFDPGSADAIADAVRASLDDAEGARDRAARARAVVEAQSVAAMSAAYESLYLQVAPA